MPTPDEQSELQPSPPPDNEGALEKALADAKEASDREQFERNIAELEQKAQAGGMPEISKAAQEGKPLTDKMIRDHDEKVIAEEEQILDDLKQRAADRATARMRKNTTCIKHIDPDTLKMDWRLMIDGSEVVRVDPEALATVQKKYGRGDLMPELAVFIEWLNNLNTSRAIAEAEVLSGGAKHVRWPDNGKRNVSPDHSGMKVAQDASADYQNAQVPNE